MTKDGRFAFVTNFGDGTISSYAIGDDGSLELVDPVAGSTVLGEKGVRDEALSARRPLPLRARRGRARSLRALRCATTAGSTRSATSTACRLTAAGLAAV